MVVALRNAGTQAEVDGTSLAPTCTRQADDILILHAGARVTAGNFQSPAGYNQIHTITQGTNLESRLWWRRATNTAADFVTLTRTAPGSGSIVATLSSWSGVPTSGSPFDFAATEDAQSAAATYTPAGVLTATSNVMVIAFAGSADDNALSVSGTGWTAAYSGASYDSILGTDQAQACAYKNIVAVTTVSPMPTFTQTINGNDGWTCFVIGLRSEAAPAPATAVNVPPVISFEAFKTARLEIIREED